MIIISSKFSLVVSFLITFFLFSKYKIDKMIYHYINNVKNYSSEQLTDTFNSICKNNQNGNQSNGSKLKIRKIIDEQPKEENQENLVINKLYLGSMPLPMMNEDSPRGSHRRFSMFKQKSFQMEKSSTLSRSKFYFI